ncbi:MAG: hypothetical protein AAFP16_01575 [Pseudomonadota bacterium]
MTEAVGACFEDIEAAMVDAQIQFNKRLTSLHRKHKAMANGYTTHLRGDGLIVVKPRMRARRNPPVRGLVYLALGFFVFKGFMFASLGDITYNERVAKMGNGTSVEQAGAWVMQADPLTQFLAGYIEPLTK